MSQAEFPHEKYADRPEGELERLADLWDSLIHAIHYLSGVLDEISDGSFTTDEAARTAEDLICSEGLDFLSAMEHYASPV